MWTGGFRNDIQGIRAVAIVVALLAHAGFAFAEGGYIGVDMFYVVSGFLITGLLVSELERSGAIRLMRFYARRVKRLVPMAILVLASTVMASQLLFSPARNDLVSGDVIAAAAHFVNWRFASQAVDYFAPDTIVSPVQHYWSLSVEEQFYLLWPALLIMATIWLRRSRHSIRPALWAMVLVPAAASLAYSIKYTSEAPDPAYFSTLTRVWELALGAGLALMPRPNFPRPAAAGLGLAGLGAIAFAVATYDSTTAFPGVAALVPTLGVVALIVAGSNAQGLTLLGRVLSSRPFVHVGDISYGLYLWHWPALIFAADIAGGPLSLWQGSLAVVAAWVLTELSHRSVEEPFRRSEFFARPPRRALALWGGGASVAIGLALVLVVVQPSVSVTPASEVAGATALDGGRAIERRADSIRPDPRDFADERGRLPREGCFLPDGETDHPPCVYGDESSDVTVVLFGDSKANQWFPPLEFLAEKHGWRLVARVKAGCPPVPAIKRGPEDEPSECDTWRESVFELIESEDPALVVVGSNRWTEVSIDDRRHEGEAAADVLAESYSSALRRLRAADARVAVMKDLPTAPQDMPSCVSENLEKLDRCWFPVPEDHGGTFEDQAVERVGGAEIVDLTGAVCPEGICRGVIGRALVYRDEGHLTSTYTNTLAPRIERQLPRLR